MEAAILTQEDETKLKQVKTLSKVMGVSMHMQIK